MKTVDGNYVFCGSTGKICYTMREAGLVINGCKKHVYVLLINNRIAIKVSS